MNNIRLEYSSLSGQFNQAQPGDTPDSANGFKTLCCLLSADRASRFIHAMGAKYPALGSELAWDIPSLHRMKRELLHFLEEDLRIMDQLMNTSFQRRTRLFSNS